MLELETSGKKASQSFSVAGMETVWRAKEI